MIRIKRASKAKRGPYRSGMEARIVPPLLVYGAAYEPLYLRFPAKDRSYTPDVVLTNGIAIEIKGYFTSADRSKMLLVMAAYPELDLRMVLASPDKKLNKKSLTTESAWCEKHGIAWAKKDVPAHWVWEKVNVASKAILDAAPRHKAKAAA